MKICKIRVHSVLDKIAKLYEEVLIDLPVRDGTATELKESSKRFARFRSGFLVAVCDGASELYRDKKNFWVVFTEEFSKLMDEASAFKGRDCLKFTRFGVLLAEFEYLHTCLQ